MTFINNTFLIDAAREGSSSVSCVLSYKSSITFTDFEDPIIIIIIKDDIIAVFFDLLICISQR